MEILDEISFKEVRDFAVKKIPTLVAMDEAQALNLFNQFEKEMRSFDIRSEAGVLRFLILCNTYSIGNDFFKKPEINSIFHYPDRDEETKVDFFHSQLIDLFDGEDSN